MKKHKSTRRATTGTRKTTGRTRNVTAALATLSEVAASLNVRPTQVRRLVARGELPCVHVGRYLRIPTSAVRRLLATTTPLPVRAVKNPGQGVQT